MRGIASGERRGLSVEFHALADRRERQTGTRVVEAVADGWRGACAGADLTRRRAWSRFASGGSRIRGKVSPSDGGSLAGAGRIATRSGLSLGALDAALAEAADGKREITAFFSGSYDRPVASLGKGLLLKRRASGLEVEISGLPDTSAVRDFEAAQERAFYAFRPYFPDDQSTFTVEGTTAVFTRADLRGIEIAAIAGPTDGLDRVRVGGRRSARRVWL